MAGKSVGKEFAADPNKAYTGAIFSESEILKASGAFHPWHVECQVFAAQAFKGSFAGK
jgi:hypothetical protein